LRLFICAAEVIPISLTSSEKDSMLFYLFESQKDLFLTADVYRFLKFHSNSLHNSISWPGDVTSGVISPLGILTRCRLSLKFYSLLL